MDLEKYRQIFLDETTTEINSLESRILRIEAATSSNIGADIEALNVIFRLFHRLKSSSAMMGLNNFSELSHRSEDLLSLIREGKIAVEGSVISVLLSVVDTMRNLIRETEGGNIEGFRPVDLLARLKQICKDNENVIPTQDVGTDLTQDVGTDLQVCPKEMDKPKGLSLRRNDNGSEVFPEASSDVSAAQIHHGLNVIRINEADLNDLIDMAGEMISTISELDRVISFLGNISSLKEVQVVNHSISSIKRKADKLSVNIHNQLLSSKMVSVGEVFERLKRVTHDLSVRTNKCMQVVMNGTEIEMDRAIVDKLFNPLLHIVRNAVDHGIETDEERLKSGKSPISTINLSATLEGHFVTISVEDDGRGIDINRVKREILKRGLLDEKESGTISENEIMSYLFQPGFSTKEEATDISGRGMGLDIVKENVKELKGKIDISTNNGCGTTVKITIPQTLSIIRCLQVFIGAETYSIPIESIMEIIPYNSNALMTVQERPLLLYRGSPVPMADLYETLNIQCRKESITSHVIIGNKDLRIAISVSEVVGEQDILIKHLGDSFSGVAGILGVGMPGGGKLSLIIDTDFLLQQYHPHPSLPLKGEGYGGGAGVSP